MPSTHTGTDPRVQHAVARLARLHNGGPPDPAAKAEAQRALTAAKTEVAIERAIALAPSITREQRDRLALLLSDQTVRTQ